MKDTTNLIKTAIITGIILFVLLGVFLAYYYVFPALKGTLEYLVPILLPFILAYVIAELIDPSVTYLVQRYKFDRGLVVLVILLILFGGLLVGLIWLISRLAIELMELSKYLPDLPSNLTSTVLEIFNRISDYYYSLGLSYDFFQQIVNNITANAEKFLNQLTVIVGQLLSSSIHFLALVPEVLLVTLFTLMATFFIARDKEKIAGKIASFLPKGASLVFDSTRKEIGLALVGIIRAQLVLMFITFLQTLIGLHFLGYDYALILALFVSLVDALPILGPGAVFIPWILLEAISKNLRLALGLAILYLFITVVRQVLQPKIVSANVGIHPLEALLGIYAGLKIFGVLGVFIGPLLLVIIKAFYRGWKKRIKE